MAGLTQEAAGRKHGWRSGLEKKVGSSLEDRGAVFDFESETLIYIEPEQRRKYTPDFVITTRSGKTIYVETKGRWIRKDRLKMKLVVEQHPDKDIRMVFQRPNERISKTSKTTYAAWCDQHLGITWATGDIPTEWLEE